VVDHGRNASRRLVLMEKFAHWRASQITDDVQSPAAYQPTSALLEEALGQLAEDEAALLRHKYCDGWTTQDLATELGTTSKAVENRLARLRERLRDILLHIQ
jgi:RNA polymerase sigma factor (sigma-70 family)